MQNPSPSQRSDQQAGIQHLQVPAVPQRATPTPKQATAPLPPQPVPSAPTPVLPQPPPAANTPTAFPTQMPNQFVVQLPPGQPGSPAVAPVTPAPVQRQVSQADIAQHQKLQLDMQQMEAYLKNVNAALYATAVAAVKSPNDLGLKQQGARYQMQLQTGRSHFATLQQQHAVLDAKLQQAVPGTSSQTGRSTPQGVNVSVANGPAASPSPVRSSHLLAVARAKASAGVPDPLPSGSMQQQAAQPSKRRREHIEKSSKTDSIVELELATHGQARRVIEVSSDSGEKAPPSKRRKRHKSKSGAGALVEA